MSAADGEDFDAEEYDVGDDLEQDEYFPFDDDEPTMQFNAGPSGTSSSSGSSSSAAIQPSSNLPLSSHLISSLNQNVFLQQQAQLNAQSHMTAYQFQVMQSQVLAQEMAMLSQNTTPAMAAGLHLIPGAAGAPVLSPGPAGSSGNPWTFSWAPMSQASQSGAAGAPAGPDAMGFNVVNSTAAPPMQQMMYAQMAHRGGSSWDPAFSKDWDQTKASDLCLGRIARDLHSLYTDPIPGIMVHANENDVTRMHALIRGPSGTPYDGGFFQFFLRCPPDYPISSPRVKLLTTGGGQVRFNPNLYANGKVCLSLLGTWAGPQWSPALNISSLLLSIQSLMCEFPYKNEPGYDRVSNNNAEVVKYNHVIQHETIRIAVIESVKEALQKRPPTGPRPLPPGPKAGAGDQSLQPAGMPSSFREMILRGFLEHHDKYLAVCAKYNSTPGAAATNGTAMPATMGDRRGSFKWEDLAKELTELKDAVQAEVDTLDNRGATDGMDDLEADDKLD